LVSSKAVHRQGAADVIVTEGFSGTIAIKVPRHARQINEFLRAALFANLASKLGYLFARGAFKALKDKLDPKQSNGGVFLGLTVSWSKAWRRHRRGLCLCGRCWLMTWAATIS